MSFKFQITWKVIIVAAAALIASLAGTIAYTERPSFCQSCHEMRPYYTSWAESSHKDANCLACHADEGLVGLLRVKAKGATEVVKHFTNTYSTPIRGEVPSYRCESCHNEPQKIVETTDLRIPHDTHLSAGLECTTCHGGVVHGEQGQGASKPSMDTCATCHDVEAQDKCTTCHKW